MLQLRKIGRKYRMQAEEVQKELNELQSKSDADQKTSLSDTVDLRTKLTSLQQELEDVSSKLSAAESDKNDALRKLKDLEQAEIKLREQITKLDEVCYWLMLFSYTLH